MGKYGLIVIKVPSHSQCTHVCVQINGGGPKSIASRMLCRELRGHSVHDNAEFFNKTDIVDLPHTQTVRLTSRINKGEGEGGGERKYQQLSPESGKNSNLILLALNCSEL